MILMKTFEETMKELQPERVKSLEKLIHEMTKCSIRHFKRRMAIEFIALFIASIYFINLIFGKMPIFPLICMSIFSTASFILITYIAHSFTFGKYLHEKIIIEKFITEYHVLKNGYDSSVDATEEIGKLRDII